MSGEVEHLIVIVDRSAIDFTRCQFDPACPVPTIYEPSEALGRDWVELNEDFAANSPWRTLSAPS